MLFLATQDFIQFWDSFFPHKGERSEGHEDPNFSNKGSFAGPWIIKKLQEF